MISGMLGMLPNLVAAAVIGVVGWIVARVVREVVTNLLAATTVDRFTQANEDTRGIRLSQLGGTLVFILVIVPTNIAALDALRTEAISRARKSGVSGKVVAVRVDLGGRRCVTTNNALNRTDIQ